MREREKSQSPPKQRRDGTSPLPVGIDWSPPSKNRNGQEADSGTGWSYLVTEVRPISKDSGPDVVNSICVELRSPEGITKTRSILKTLPDFMKLITDLEKKFPEKKELRNLKTQCQPIKERCTVDKEMEEMLSDIEGSLGHQVPSIKQRWITQLLSDIDLLRSFEVASFLELEAAVRAFHSEDQDVNPQNSEANSHEMPTQSNLPTILGSSLIKSDYASDTAYGKAEPGTPRIRKDENSEIDINVVGKDVHVGRTSETSLLSSNYRMDHFSEPEHRKVIAHACKLLSESAASVVSSLRGSEISNSAIPDSSGDGSIDHLGGAKTSSSMNILRNLDLHGSGGPQLFLPLDHNHKLIRLLRDTQRRVGLAETDMKGLMETQEQETAFKICLEAKIKEFGVEQEIDRQKIEALNQVLTTEKDKNISLRWEMDELRQKSLKMQLELEAKSEKEELLLRELSSNKERQENVSKQYKKKAADCKALVGEVIRLRNVQQKLEEEKSEAEEKLYIKQAEDANKELQHQSELFDLLKILGDRIGFLLTEVAEALRKEGLDSSKLILGIDFTKSNEWTGKYSFNNRSLHALGNALNPYEKAIFIIGKTLAPFNEANLIPCFGFGEDITRDQEVFSFYDDNLPCHGFEEVLSRYRKLVPILKLAGPTSYAPIVDAAINIVEKSGGQYHVLVIIADGQVTRNVATSEKELSPQEEATIRSIVDSSSYPLSIILVGVGDGPWENIRKLEDKIRGRRFDNFQFVIFNDNARESTSSSYETAFAHAALMKIPDQFKDAKELDLLGKTTGNARKVLPRPPPVPHSQSLLSDILDSLSANDKDSEPHMMTCRVCLSSAIDTSFGCGHTICEACAARITICHICRKPIEVKHRVYL